MANPNNHPERPLEFPDEQAAIDHLESQFDGSDNPDNFRFAYLDDLAGLEAYEKAVSRGCCGYADIEILVGGRPAMVGCNYGH